MDYYGKYGEAISLIQLFERLNEDFKVNQKEIKLKNEHCRVHFNYQNDLDFSIKSKSHCLKFSYESTILKETKNTEIRIEFYKNNNKILNDTKVSYSKSLYSIEPKLLEYESLDKIFFIETYHKGINLVLNELEKTN